MTESDRCGPAGVSRRIGRRGIAGAGALNAVAILALACLLSGCGGNERAAPQQTGTTKPSLLVSDYAITIQNNNFSYLSAPNAAQIKVLNRDDVAHTVTSDTPGLFDVHVGPRDETVFISPEKPGTYPYHSTGEPSMHGELVIYQRGH